MKPIDENTPKDRELVLWFPLRGGMLAYGCWNEQKYYKKPRPYWTSYALERLYGVLAIRENQPTHWDEKPTSPDQVMIAAPVVQCSLPDIKPVDSKVRRSM